MTTSDLATIIFTEWEQPTDTTADAIAFWLKSNIGSLNATTGSSFSVADDGTISPDPTLVEVNIFKDLYEIYRYEILIRRNLGAAAYDWSEVSEGDSSVRRVSKNEIAKTLRSMKQDAEADLATLLGLYRAGRVLPVSLGGINNLQQYIRVDL